MINKDKEVYFDIYCKKCVHEKNPDSEDPCDFCLSNPSNVYSHKPISYEKKEGVEE